MIQNRNENLENLKSHNAIVTNNCIEIHIV